MQGNTRRGRNKSSDQEETPVKSVICMSYGANFKTGECGVMSIHCERSTNINLSKAFENLGCELASEWQNLVKLGLTCFDPIVETTQVEVQEEEVEEEIQEKEEEFDKPKKRRKRRTKKQMEADAFEEACKKEDKENLEDYEDDEDDDELKLSVKKIKKAKAVLDADECNERSKDDAGTDDDEDCDDEELEDQEPKAKEKIGKKTKKNDEDEEDEGIDEDDVELDDEDDDEEADEDDGEKDWEEMNKIELLKECDEMGVTKSIAGKAIAECKKHTIIIALEAELEKGE